MPTVYCGEVVEHDRLAGAGSLGKTLLRASMLRVRSFSAMFSNVHTALVTADSPLKNTTHTHTLTHGGVVFVSHTRISPRLAADTGDIVRKNAAVFFTDTHRETKHSAESRVADTSSQRAPVHTCVRMSRDEWLLSRPWSIAGGWSVWSRNFKVAVQT